MAAPDRPKGILKTASSDHPEGEEHHGKQMKWDEMNILATYHPADKDYGHMKIDDPPTPYQKDTKSDDEDDMDPENLARRLEEETDKKPKVVISEDDASSEEDVNESSEDRAKRKAFEKKRKLHYNEFQAVKLARQLMQSTDADEEEGQEQGDDSPRETETPDNSPNRESDEEKLPNQE